MYSDDYLNYWGFVFQVLGLAAHDLRFETFIENPHDYLYLARCEPLLPQQPIVQQRLDTTLQDKLEKDPTVICRNGTFVEPLHHTAWPRHANKRV